MYDLRMLNVAFYTKVFMHFVQQKDFTSLLKMLKHTPRHVTNADKLLAELQPLLSKRRFKEDDELLAALYHLYKLKASYENAFYISLKRRDAKIFDFLAKHKIDFPINPIFGKLLQINAIKATQYVLNRHVRGLKTSGIVENCLL